MLLRSFCGKLSLTAGMVILGFCLLMLAFIALVSNIFFLIHFETGMIFVLVFILVLIVAGALMIAAAFKENRNLSLLARAMMTLALLMFAVGSVISLANQGSMLEYVCVHNGRRCPETMWGASLDFRKGATSDHKRSDMKDRVHKLTPIQYNRRGRQDYPPPEPTEPDSTAVTTTIVWTDFHTTTKTPTTEEDDEYSLPSTTEDDNVEEWDIGYKFGPHLIAAAIVCAIHFILLVFCVLIAFSYSQELQYIAKLHVN